MKPGERLRDYLQGVVRAGERQVERDRNGNVDSYVLTGDGARVEVSIELDRGFGLRFDVASGRNEDRPITYTIDTDLYDISRHSQQEFAVAIEDEIIAFLSALLNGEFSVGEVKGRPAVVFPGDDGFYRLRRGRVVTSKSHFATREEAESPGRFTSMAL